MVDYARVRAVKQAVQGRLLLLPGVHAVAVGPKRVNHQPTDDPSIIVFLVKKKPLSELAPEDVVPAEIDGVKTDVIEMDVPRLHASLDHERKRPLVGGLSIQAKDQPALGTLGCFGHTNEPEPKVVAITCQHVVDPPAGSTKSSVKVTPPAGSNPATISFSIQGTTTTGSIQGTTTTGSLVLVTMIDPAASATYNAWWRVTATDTAATIAKNVAAAISAISGAGVSATTTGQPPTSVVISIAPGRTTQVAECIVYDPAVVYGDADLTVTIAGNVITLAGTVGGDYCAYVTWNTDSGDPSRGVLTLLPKGTSLADAAAAIAASVTNLTITGITATSTPATVTVAGAAQVGCAVLGDQRVGQPDDSFSSDCSMCCANEMGRVLAASLSVDAALIQVRRKFQYLNEIVGGNPAQNRNMVITGAYTVTDADVHASYAVHKRGITTGYTSGIVTALAATGYVVNSPDDHAWVVLHRFYQNAMVVEGSGGSSFSDQGDSGSAVFDDAGNVVGILFGGGETQTLVTPIEQITSGLNITVATSTELNQAQTVSDAQGAPAAVAPADDQLLRRVLTTQAEITSTPAGKRYAELITRHAREVQGLVNDNRRVTVAWHRNGGPQILRAALRYVGQRDERLPAEIDGEPLAERLSRIGGALARYGSDELSEDLTRYGPELLQLTSMSYAQALERMRGGDRAGADAD